MMDNTVVHIRTYKVRIDVDGTYHTYVPVKAINSNHAMAVAYAFAEHDFAKAKLIKIVDANLISGG